MLDMRNQLYSAACAHEFVMCCFSALSQIIWDAGQLSAEACAVLSQAYMPSLEKLCLSDQGLSAVGLLELLPAPWPHLFHLYLRNTNLDPIAVAALSNSSWCRRLGFLSLDGNALGEAGVRALGLGHWETLIACNLSSCGIRSHAAFACLAQIQFPALRVLVLTGNGYEVGAVACLSGAHWPIIRSFRLGSQDLEECDYDILGISKSHYYNDKESDTLYHPTNNSRILPNL